MLRPRRARARPRSPVRGTPTGPQEESLALLVSKTRGRLLTAATRALGRKGESIHVYRVLAQLEREGPSTQIALASATAQHPAAISRLLDQLEQGRFIARKRDAADRRHFHVTITASGRRRFQKLEPLVRDATTKIFRPLSTRDCATLAELLKRIVNPPAALDVND